MVWEGTHDEALPEHPRFVKQVYWLKGHSILTLKMSVVCLWSSLFGGRQYSSQGHMANPQTCGLSKSASDGLRSHHRCFLQIVPLVLVNHLLTDRSGLDGCFTTAHGFTGLSHLPKCHHQPRAQTREPVGVLHIQTRTMRFKTHYSM